MRWDREETKEGELLVLRCLPLEMTLQVQWTAGGWRWDARTGQNSVAIGGPHADRTAAAREGTWTLTARLNYAIVQMERALEPHRRLAGATQGLQARLAGELLVQVQRWRSTLDALTMEANDLRLLAQMEEG